MKWRDHNDMKHIERDRLSYGETRLKLYIEESLWASTSCILRHIIVQKSQGCKFSQDSREYTTHDREWDLQSWIGYKYLQDVSPEQEATENYLTFQEDHRRCEFFTVGVAHCAQVLSEVRVFHDQDGERGLGRVRLNPIATNSCKWSSSGYLVYLWTVCKPHTSWRRT